MVESYIHKGAIEDQVKLIQHHVNDLRETEIANGRPIMNSDGKTVKKKPRDESFKNVKAAVGSYIDVAFYGKGNLEEGVTKEDVLTKEEKEQKAHLAELLENESLTERERENIQKQHDEIGGKRTMSKVGDKMLRWVQLKGMGFNVLGGFSNVFFGTVSNWTHAAGGQDFSSKNYAKAWSLSLSMIGGKTTQHSKKIFKLMHKFDVLKESANDLGANDFTKFMSNYGPYAISKYTEMMNQAPVMIAMMMEQGIWDKFDADGNYTGEGDFDLGGKEFHGFKNKLDHVIKMLHGNYDPDSPIQMKRQWVGRALSQFRTWMFESFANRFEDERFDEILGRTRKGRYKSYKKEHLLILPALRDFYKAFAGTYTDGTDLGDMNQANLKRNAVELVVLLGIMSTLMMLGGDDDDEEDSMLRNLLVNQLMRVQTDITFYVDPAGFEALTKQSVPAMGLVTDVYQTIEAAWKFLNGEDEIKSGVFAGDSRITREVMQLFPGTSQAYRIYSSGSQTFNKK